MAERVALVTGGGAGIGEATCLRLARDGCAVGVLGLREENTSAVARAIVEASMGIAANLCIFTNDRFSIETVARNQPAAPSPESDAALPLGGYLPPAGAGADRDDTADAPAFDHDGEDE